MTPFGKYKYLQMPFGVSPAPEVCEHKLHEKLDDLLGIVVIGDDILIMGHSDTHEQAVKDCNSNLTRQRTREVNLKLNKSKINLRQTEVSFMGHVVTSQGVRPDPGKVKAVEDMPRPTCKKELSSLLCFVNYLSKFLPHLSEVAHPLHELKAQEAPFMWSSQHEYALAEIKKMVVNHPVLKFYDPQAEVTLQCNVSDYGLGAALLQDGQLVAYE